MAKREVRLEDVDPDVKALMEQPVVIEDEAIMEPLIEELVIKVEDWPEGAFIVTPEVAYEMVVYGTYRGQGTNEVVVFAGADEQVVFALELSAIKVRSGGKLYVNKDLNIPVTFPDFYSVESAFKDFDCYERVKPQGRRF